ncbi:MAG TPA: Ig-like domain-containing protein, partial [Burkholderiales bacterium]|nr:Ig-like domain-containing protein [Burkholderiales bacterium]
NDLANYTMGENLGAHDVYDGGAGTDTLQISVTTAELNLASVQADIAAFQAFLERHGHGGKTFHFQAFDLDARGFEKLEIFLINTPPVAAGDSYTLDEDHVLLVAGPGVLANDTDIDGDALTAALVDLPTHGTVALNADGSFSYTPDENYFGADSFTYRANDGAADSGLATVSLVVNPVNDAPVAVDDSAQTDEDQPVIIGVLYNDRDVEGDPLVPLIETGPGHGSLTVNSDGTVTYTPDADFFGEDSFTYRASDGTDPSEVPGVVTVTVIPVNDPPSATDDSYTTNEDTLLTGNVLDNDTDVDGDELSVAGAGTFTTARGATVVLGADGSFSYDPRGSAELQALAAGASVLDTFQYTVSDGLLSDTANVNITVTGLAEPGSGGGSAGDASSGKLLPSISPETQLDYYVRFGTTGDWLALQDLQLGFSNSGSAQVGGGGGAGKVSVSDLSFVLGSSNAVVELTQDLLEGQHLNRVEIEAYQGGGFKGLLGQLVDQYTLEEVLVSSLQTSGSPTSTTESLSLNFAKISYGHIDYDSSGKELSTDSVSYDVAANEFSGGGPSVSPDAKLDTTSLSTDVQLHYYVSFEGAGGWLELESFQMGMSQSGSTHVGGGGGAGKVSVADVQLALGESSAILDLLEGVATGKHFEFFEVEAYLGGGGSKGGLGFLVDEYRFEDVLVSGLQSSGTEHDVSLNFAAFEHTHTEQTSTGTKGDIATVGWDIAQDALL